MTSAHQAAADGGREPVRPFAGLVVTADWAERVVSPMLDAVTPEQHDALLAKRAESWLHVTAGGRLHTDVQPSPGPTGAAALHRLLEQGAFRPQPPGLYVYRIADRRGAYTGLVADVATEAFVTGWVRGHEAVQPDRVDAVLRYFKAVPARSELVALLRQPDPDIDAVVERTCEGSPMLDFVGGPYHQTVWRVRDEDVPALTQSLSSHLLYVADGHHRVAASLRAWQEAGRPAAAGIPCVLYAPEGLRLESFHRRVRGPVDARRLVEELPAGARQIETDGPCPEVGTVAVYVAGRWLALTLPTSEADQSAGGVDALDVARLHARVLGPLLGIETVSDPRLEIVPATDAVDGLVARCDADGGALFVLAAPSLAQLIDVADRRQVMLAKSTFFEPKPQAGVFVELVSGTEKTSVDVP